MREEWLSIFSPEVGRHGDRRELALRPQNAGPFTLSAGQKTLKTNNKSRQQKNAENFKEVHAPDVVARSAVLRRFGPVPIRYKSEEICVRQCRS